MKFKFFSSFFDLMGCSLLEVPRTRLPRTQDTGPVTIQDAINYLETRRAGFRELVFDGGEVRRLVKIIKNGRDVAFLQGLTTPVDDDDAIAFFPPVGGG